MTFGMKLSLVFLALWCLSLGSDHGTLTTLLLVNGIAQVGWFALVACVPYLRTGRVSYVDIAWPFGVALIGIEIWLLGDAGGLRAAAVGGAYLFVGLRMGLGALALAKRTGVIFTHEFPRYEYRRLVLQDAGVTHVRAHLLAEIMAQGLANASVLALPGFLMATNRSNAVSAWEIAGGGIWAVAYLLETVADVQKMRFVAKHRGAVCDTGLWRYSRHPNYFAEWLVWTGLVVASVPSWLALRSTTPALVWIGLGLGAVGASAAMYTTLVYLTGAMPAEHFSVRRRAGYRSYQQRTSMFFPWFPRHGDAAEDASPVSTSELSPPSTK